MNLQTLEQLFMPLREENPPQKAQNKTARCFNGDKNFKKYHEFAPMIIYLK